jgi:hypothetical protein
MFSDAAASHTINPESTRGVYGVRRDLCYVWALRRSVRSGLQLRVERGLVRLFRPVSGFLVLVTYSSEGDPDPDELRESAAMVAHLRMNRRPRSCGR